MTLPQGKSNFFFKLGLIIGDNLGLHSMLGFVESFQANFICRFCKMDTLQRSPASLKDVVYLRTKSSYKNDLLLHDKSRTGIKEESVFLKVPDYDVTENLSLDIMHDLFQGVFEFDMVALMNYYTHETESFSLKQLNSRMMCHDWGLTDFGNIPPLISEKGFQRDTIRLSASEMFIFIRHFGILDGDLVSKNDSAWQIYVIIRQILALVMSPSIQMECSIILRDLIKEHHVLVRNELKRHLKPKDHFRIHLPRVMEHCGPLVHLWCMRFEGKHHESRLLLSTSCCKKNLLLHFTRKLFILLTTWGLCDLILLKDCQLHFRKIYYKIRNF